MKQALDVLMEGRTTIIVAHRLSTVKEAQQICVLDEGRVAELGTFNELMARGEDGLFHKLVSQQQQRMSDV